MSDQQEFTQEQARAMYDMLMGIFVGLVTSDNLSTVDGLRIHKLLHDILVSQGASVPDAAEQDTQS